MNNSKIFANHHKELITNWYQKWTVEVRKRLPQDFVVTDDEIDSEITYQCQYLSSIFRGGNYPAFCNRYVVNRVVTEFWNEYKLLDHDSIIDAYKEFENDYVDSYTVSRQYGEYATNAYSTIDNKIENNDIAENLKTIANDSVGRQIVQMWLEGFPYEVIAQKLKISTKTIQRRIKEICNELKSLNSVGE